MKLLFVGGTSFAALVVLSTCLMPWVLGASGAESSNAPAHAVVESLITPSSFDSRLAADIRELQGFALLRCIAAQPSKQGATGLAESQGRKVASRYEAIYGQLSARPSIQQALARMQVAEIQCGSSVARSLEKFQRAAHALDSELDSANTMTVLSDDAAQLQVGD